MFADRSSDLPSKRSREGAEIEDYLLVENVTGAAAQAGVRNGDVILGVNRGRPHQLTNLWADA